MNLERLTKPIPVTDTTPLAELMDRLLVDRRDAADEIERLREALRKISNMGQTNVPDHWDFRVKAREIARAALGEGK